MNTTKPLPGVLPVLVLLLLASVASAADYKVEKVVTGTGAGTWKAFNAPSDVWIDENSSRIFIADAYNYAIQVYDLDMNYQTLLGGSAGQATTDTGLMRRRSVTFFQGRIYVAVEGVGGVKLFTCNYGGDSSLGIGAQSEAYRLSTPSGVAVDAN
ncbi:Uncharacterised protein [Candidatus Burarchaeum australiense]|nr:Uncharacterised protein [Candidatus Burarchaeum australiense]